MIQTNSQTGGQYQQQQQQQQQLFVCHLKLDFESDCKQMHTNEKLSGDNTHLYQSVLVFKFQYHSSDV